MGLAELFIKIKSSLISYESCHPTNPINPINPGSERGLIGVLRIMGLAEVLLNKKLP